MRDARVLDSFGREHDPKLRPYVIPYQAEVVEVGSGPNAGRVRVRLPGEVTATSDLKFVPVVGSTPTLGQMVYTLANFASRVVITSGGESGGPGVTDHGGLTGLLDDDHTQYALADGTRLRGYRSTTAPTSPAAGQFWLDTNSAPAVLKQYDGASWQTIGGGSSGSAPSEVTILTRATAFVATDAVHEAVIWTTEVRDDGGWWASGSPTRVTLPEAGPYIFTYGFAGLEVPATPAGRRRFELYKNGTLIDGTAQDYDRSYSAPHEATWVVDCAAGDYVEVRHFQNQGSNQDVNPPLRLIVTRAGGAQGPAGAPGTPGAPGAAGADGLPSLAPSRADPLPGPRGYPGIPGMPGQDGAPGTPGAPGAAGADGLPSLAPRRADPLPGPRGYPGVPGMPGAAGSSGAAGADGPPGAPIIVRNPQIGIPGPRGFMGPPGPEGPAGGGGGGEEDPFRTQSGANALFAAWGDGDPGIAVERQFSAPATAAPTNTAQTITVMRGVRFRLPKALSVSNVYIWSLAALAAGSGWRFGIYPVAAGSARLWDSGNTATLANAWINITAGTPFSLSADTDYYLGAAPVAAGTTAPFRTPNPPPAVGYYGNEAAPLGGRSIGIPSMVQWTVAAGAPPATLPATAQLANVTGSVPIAFLVGTAS